MTRRTMVNEGQEHYEIDRLVDLYNEGKDEARRVHWDKANEDFIDPDAGRWRPYLLQTWHRDLIATFETTSDLIALLKSLDADIAYQEHNNREIREGLEAHGRDEFDQSNEED